MARLLVAAKESFFHPVYGYKTSQFWGPLANWGIVGASVYDAVNKGPETISPTGTGVLLAYSCVFQRFALKVQPVNYLLFACHMFNIGAQSYQLNRWSNYHTEQTKIAQTLPEKDKQALLTKIGPGLPFETIAAAVAACGVGIVLGQKVLKPAITSMTPVAGTTADKFKNMMLHPAGLFFIHFWAPIFKWSLSINNILEWDRDINQISLPQQSALALTGLIWSRYSLVIKPKNWSLFAVNFVLALTGLYHVGRKIKHEMNQTPAQTTGYAESKPVVAASIAPPASVAPDAQAAQKNAV
jgi:hypothetical protein